VGIAEVGAAAVTVVLPAAVAEPVVLLGLPTRAAGEGEPTVVPVVVSYSGAAFTLAVRRHPGLSSVCRDAAQPAELVPWLVISAGRLSPALATGVRAIGSTGQSGDIPYPGGEIGGDIVTIATLLPPADGWSAAGESGAYAEVRVDDISDDHLKIRVHDTHEVDGGVAVAWLAAAVTSGGMLGQLRYEAMETSGSLSHAPYNVAFSGGFGATDAVALFGGLEYSNSKAHLRLAGPAAVTGAGTQIFVEEEQCAAGDESHTGDLGYLFALEVGSAVDAEPPTIACTDVDFDSGDAGVDVDFAELLVDAFVSATDDSLVAGGALTLTLAMPDGSSAQHVLAGGGDGLFHGAVIEISPLAEGPQDIAASVVDAAGNSAECHAFVTLGRPAIATDPPALAAEVSEMSTAVAAFTVGNSGTADLFLHGLTVHADWAIVLEAGEAVDSRAPIAPGGSREFHVQFQGAAAGGLGLRAANMTILSNDPLSPLLSVGLQITVATAALVLVVLPQAVTAQAVLVGESAAQTLTVFNTLGTAVTWTLADCTCPAGVPAGQLACAVATAASWLRLEACSGAMPGLGQGTLGVQLVAPTALGSHTRVLEFEAAGVLWPVQVQLSTATAVAFFQPAPSRVAVPRDEPVVVLAPVRLAVEPVDMYGNAIALPGIEGMVLRIASDSEATQEGDSPPAREEVVRFDFEASAYYAVVTAWRAGPYTATVVTAAGEAVGAPVAITALPVPCTPPGFVPTEDGGACDCAPGFGGAGCLRCGIGYVSLGGRRATCEACPGGRQPLPPTLQGATACEPCAGGQYKSNSGRG
jgi:hypothetical protein